MVDPTPPPPAKGPQTIASRPCCGPGRAAAGGGVSGRVRFAHWRPAGDAHPLTGTPGGDPPDLVPWARGAVGAARLTAPLR